MNIALKDIDCNICKSNDIKVIFEASLKNGKCRSFSCACTNDGHGEYYRLVQCKACGLKYSSPRPEAPSLETEYSNIKDELYLTGVKGRIKTFEKNLRNISKYKNKGTLVDVGCSIGIFPYLAKKNGWSVIGLEPSKWCVEQAKSLFNINIDNGTHKDLVVYNKKFDVITMWDVLEHLADPIEALKDCRNALKDDGILAFSTVDIGSLYARLFGKKWPWLMEMHIYYFDRKSIKSLLEKAGFRAIKIKCYIHIVSLQYLQYKLKKINRFLYLFASAVERIFFKKEVCIPVCLGDFMEVYAVKD